MRIVIKLVIFHYIYSTMQTSISRIMAFATLWYDYEVQCRLYDNLLTIYLLKNAILLLENIYQNGEKLNLQLKIFSQSLCLMKCFKIDLKVKCIFYRKKIGRKCVQNLDITTSTAPNCCHQENVIYFRIFFTFFRRKF